MMNIENSYIGYKLRYNEMHSYQVYGDSVVDRIALKILEFIGTYFYSKCTPISLRINNNVYKMTELTLRKLFKHEIQLLEFTQNKLFNYEQREELIHPLVESTHQSEIPLSIRKLIKDLRLDTRNEMLKYTFCPRTTVMVKRDGADVPYLNANRITLHGNEYIAAAYPAAFGSTEDELHLFWSTIHDQKCATIVKLHDAFSYWPEAGETLKVGNLTITNNSEVEKGPIKIRKLKVEKVDNENARSTHEVVHVDFSAWPDFDIPTTKDLSKLIYTLGNLEKQQSNPLMFVHCLGGKGRTGTFLAIHSTQHLDNVDFEDTLEVMRSQRCNQMVETKEQFEFAAEMHDLIRDNFHSFNSLREQRDCK